MAPYQTLAFYIAVAITLAIFFAGLFFKFSLYAKKGFSSASINAHGAMRRALLVCFGPFLTRRGLSAFLLDAMLQRSLWRLSKLRWLMSISLTFGFLELFFIGSLGDLAIAFGLAGFNKDAAWFAAANEAGGIALLLGLTIAFNRRYMAKSHMLDSTFVDGLTIGWLMAIILTGYLVEATRLAAEGVSGGRASFIAHWLAPLIVATAEGARGAYTSIWWSHTAISLALVAYIPYGKLFHMIASPITIVANAAAIAPRQQEALPRITAGVAAKRA